MWGCESVERTELGFDCFAQADGSSSTLSGREFEYIGQMERDERIEKGCSSVLCERVEKGCLSSGRNRG